MNDWNSIDTAPGDREVWTKIHDERGERNVAKLTRKGRLWFTHPTDGMYVYYSPTHWKTASASPDDDRWEDGDDEPCEHDDYDIDTLNGYAFCWRCGDRRMLSDHEIAAQIAHEAAYARMEARWNRWRWWRDLKDKLRSLIPHRKHVIANRRRYSLLSAPDPNIEVDHE